MDNLYDNVAQVTGTSGRTAGKKELFGERPAEARKLTVLRLFGLVSEPVSTKLTRLTELRNLYVHSIPDANAGTNIEADAREAITLFRNVLSERFDSQYTISKGRIVPREPNPSR